MIRSTRRLPVIAALAAAIAVFATGCTRNMDAWDAAVLINQTRNDRGIHSLDIDEVLVAKAQAWAEHMAASGRISHSSLTQGAGDDWRVLGENVGWARSTDEMHQLFMESTSHRTTLLDRRYDRFGVGVAVVNGRYYTAMVFAG